MSSTLGRLCKAKRVCHHERVTTKPTITDDWLRDSKARHARRLEAAEEERDQELRDALDASYKQTEIVRLTEWTRETVRQALKPDIKAAIRERRRAHRSATQARRTNREH